MTNFPSTLENTWQLVYEKKVIQWNACQILNISGFMWKWNSLIFVVLCSNCTQFRGIFVVVRSLFLISISVEKSILYKSVLQDWIHAERTVDKLFGLINWKCSSTGFFLSLTIIINENRISKALPSLCLYNRICYLVTCNCWMGMLCWPIDWLLASFRPWFFHIWPVSPLFFFISFFYIFLSA